jgi:hypothetical protein
MHKIETILGGIALILFGIWGYNMAVGTEWLVFSIIAFAAPLLGIAAVVYALLQKDEKGEE